MLPSRANTLVKRSNKYPLRVLFSDGKKDFQVMAVQIAKKCPDHKVAEINEHKFHLVSFSQDKRSMQKALMLMRAVYQQKTTQIFWNGEPEEDKYQVIRVIECYLKSTRTRTKKYCRRKLINPQSPNMPASNLEIGIRITAFGLSITDSEHLPSKKREKVLTYTLPCQMLPAVNIRDRTEANMKAQILDDANHRRCVVCPKFDLDNFKQD